MITCTSRCEQGRRCTCYRANFDGMGNQIPSPWLITDLLIAIFLVVSIATVLAGA